MHARIHGGTLWGSTSTLWGSTSIKKLLPILCWWSTSLSLSLFLSIGKGKGKGKVKGNGAAYLGLVADRAGGFLQNIGNFGNHKE